MIEQETLIDTNEGLEFAPGEGHVPLSLLLDDYAEELAFPQIYCGHKRMTEPLVKLSYSEIVLSEIMRRDRRAVVPDHLLYMHKKCHLLQIRSNVNNALRKSSERNGHITVNAILNEGAIRDLAINS